MKIPKEKKHKAELQKSADINWQLPVWAIFSPCFDLGFI